MRHRRLYLLLSLLTLLAMSITAHALGQAAFSPTSEWTAGARTQFALTYTAGPEGVAAGGAVAAGFPHAVFIRLSTDPARPEGVTASRSDGLPIEVEDIEWPDPAMTPGRNKPGDPAYMIRHLVIARITDKPLDAGGTVTLNFGTGGGVTMQAGICDNPVRVLVDTAGEGKLHALPESPACRIVSGPLSQLFVTAPTTATVGQTVDIRVRAEDRLCNLADASGLDAMLTGLPRAESATAPFKDGVARLDAIIMEPGVYRITAGVNGLTARSNPMLVTAEPPAYNIYWGDMHSHSNLSDGMQSIDYLYTYARDAADLDVCASADHAPREGSRLAVNKYYEPGKFVTIWGYEWAESQPGRLDRNIYFHSPDDPPLTGWPPTIEGFWASIKAVYGANEDHRVIVGPHMFTYETKSRPWHETWNADYERFVEIYSEHGMSEFEGNPRMLAGGKVQRGFFMQDGLAAGRRFGVIGSSDTHDSRPGRGSNSLQHRGGIVAFLAKDLTRESVWDAFWNRRVYAATNERVAIDFQIDGRPMGEEITTSAPPEITYTAYGCDDAFDVILLKNNQPLRTDAAIAGKVAVSFTDDAFTGDSFYYLRVVQHNGEWAWSSPIWVGKTP